MKEEYILQSKRDKIKWEETLNCMPSECRDIYFRPEYLEMDCRNEDARAIMYVYKNNHHIWCFPFIMQRISKNILEKKDDYAFYDIESQYGYGGPISNSCDGEFIYKASKTYVEWCKRSRVVAQFIRFHPIVKNHKMINEEYKIIRDRNTVAIRIDHNEKENLFSKKVRYMIKRASNSGVRVGIVEDENEWEKYVEMYLDNMKRLNAEKYYYFDKKYYSKLKVLVKNHGYILKAEYDKKWIGAAVFLSGEISLNYHLSAKNEKCIPGTMNMIIDEAVKICREKKYQYLHLGGGRTAMENDTLLKYKLSMGNQIENYYIGKKIYLEEKYKEIENKYKTNNQVSNNKILFYKEM